MMRSPSLWLGAVVLAVVTACGPAEKEACPTGQSSCSDECRDLTTDAQNCGACGTACATGQSCMTGICVGAIPACGNGLVEGAEACDDGDTHNDDGCSGTCTIEPGFACSGAPSVCTSKCGDGQVAGAEACDDGNLSGGDGCSAACAIETGYACQGAPSNCVTTCGDGIVVTGVEACDDGNAAGGDGCSQTCTVEANYQCSGSPSQCKGVCGDGILLGAEPCDDGNTFGGDGCSGGCNLEAGYTCTGTPSVCVTTCGDGVQAGSELCDDGNTGAGDGCSASCMLESGFTCTGSPSVCAAVCGDGTVKGAETCDDGNQNDADACTNSCTVRAGYTCSGEPSACVPVCGDGLVVSGEACDDQNTGGGDGCSAACAVEPGYACNGAPSVCAPVCGDGILLGSETCDDGNPTGGDGCSAACGVELGFTCSGLPSSCTTTCGDGIKASVEACDDGDIDPGDGCSAACAVETGFVCFGSPSTCLTGTAEVEPNDDGTVAVSSDDFSATASNGPYSATLLLTGALSPAGDDDGFALSNPGTTPIGVRLDVWDPALGVGVSCGTAGVDTQLRLRDAAGTDLVGNVDRGWADYCSSVDYVIPAGQTVYAHLASYQDTAAIAGYLLQVRFAACGNNVPEPGEQCDDGNVTAGDGCSATCQYESPAPTGFTCAPGETLVQVSSTDVPKTIPDPDPTTGPQPVTSIVTIPNTGTLARVVVGIDGITHTYVSDLGLAITAPSGRTGWLVWEEGGAGANFTNTVLDDHCATAPGLGSITGKTAPFTGCYAPKASLSPLRGESATGTWTLHVIDYESPDPGTLTAWKLGLCLK